MTQNTLFSTVSALALTVLMSSASPLWASSDLEDELEPGSAASSASAAAAAPADTAAASASAASATPANTEPALRPTPPPVPPRPFRAAAAPSSSAAAAAPADAVRERREGEETAPARAAIAQAPLERDVEAMKYEDQLSVKIAEEWDKYNILDKKTTEAVISIEEYKIAKITGAADAIEKEISARQAIDAAEAASTIYIEAIERVIEAQFNAARAKFGEHPTAEQVARMRQQQQSTRKAREIEFSRLEHYFAQAKTIVKEL